MEDYEKRLSVHNAAEIGHRNALEAVKVYSYLRVDVTKPPEPLSVICLGMERHPRKHAKGFLRRCQPRKRKFFGGGNPLLNVFSAVHAVLMVQIAFSLFVISIAYDVICGERERGTLALLASNPVSKYHILIGEIPRRDGKSHRATRDRLDSRGTCQELKPDDRIPNC